MRPAGAIEVQGECRVELVRSMLSRSLQSLKSKSIKRGRAVALTGRHIHALGPQGVALGCWLTGLSGRSLSERGNCDIIALNNWEKYRCVGVKCVDATLNNLKCVSQPPVFPALQVACLLHVCAPRSIFAGVNHPTPLHRASSAKNSSVFEI